MLREHGIDTRKNQQQILDILCENKPQDMRHDHEERFIHTYTFFLSFGMFLYDLPYQTSLFLVGS